MMLSALLSRITSGMWKYIALSGAALAVLAKVFAMGRSKERKQRLEEHTDNLETRNEVLEDINSMSDDDVDSELRKRLKSREQ